VDGAKIRDGPVCLKENGDWLDNIMIHDEQHESEVALTHFFQNNAHGFGVGEVLVHAFIKGGLFSYPRRPVREVPETAAGRRSNVCLHLEWVLNVEETHPPEFARVDETAAGATIERWSPGRRASVASAGANTVQG